MFLQLSSLLVEFLLLLIELVLLRVLPVLLALELIPDQPAPQGSDSAANRCARARSADCGTDDRAGGRPQTAAYQNPFFSFV